MKNYYKILIVIFIFFISCKQLPPFKGKQDLVGSWHCEKIEITTPRGTNFGFLMRKYGFANFSIYQDSLYSFSMNILQDVVLEKEILGGTYSKTVLQAGYKNTRTGYYQTTDSSLILFDFNKVKINEESYSFCERVLLTTFTDEDKRFWKIFWKKDN